MVNNIIIYDDSRDTTINQRRRPLRGVSASSMVQGSRLCTSSLTYRQRAPAVRSPAWFLEIAFIREACVRACVCVCVSMASN